MDLEQIGIECDLAIENGEDQRISRLIDKVASHLKADDLSDDALAKYNYFLGNLYSELSIIRKEDFRGWRTKEFPENMVNAINRFRRAKTFATSRDDFLRNEIRTNLANQIAHQRRTLECFEKWTCDFSTEGDGPYVSALSKAREFIWVSHWLSDSGHANCYLLEAYSLLNDLQSNLTNTNHPGVIKTMNNDPQITKVMEFGRDKAQTEIDWDKNFTCPNYSDDEKNYRSWCLKNRLFVNPLNDITQEWVAGRDILQFPNHIVNVGEGPYFSAAFSSLKREYCFARFLAYEGINGIHPQYENTQLFLTDTLDRVCYEGHTEKVKTAFRICFSVLDSLAMLINKYFECNRKNASFTSKWIRDNLKVQKSPFVDALYWLSCDLTDISSISEEKWKAPNPDSSKIRRMRNALEHSWVRVTEESNSIWDDKNDYAYIVTASELEKNTVSVLKLVRCAIIYFCLAVKYEEDKKSEIKPTGLTVPMTTPMIEDDLISMS